MAVVRRFHSPFGHWVSGLLAEIAVLAAFIAVCAAVTYLIVSLF